MTRQPTDYFLAIGPGYFSPGTYTLTGTGGRHVYDQPGNFFLETKKGWVFISEGSFPTYLGFWMKVFNMAGPGSPVPSTDWGSYPDKGCEF